MNLNNISSLYECINEIMKKNDLCNVIETFKQMNVLKSHDTDVCHKTYQMFDFYYLLMNTYSHGEIVSIEWSPDGLYLLLSFPTSPSKVLELSSDILVRRICLEGDFVRSTSWSRVKENVIAITERQHLSIFDVLKGIFLRKLKATSFGEEYKRYSFASWSPTNLYLAVALSDDSIFSKLSISARGDLEKFLKSENKSGVLLLDFDADRVINIYRGNGTILSMSWSPDGQKLAIGFGNGKLIIKDINNGGYDKYNFKIPIMDVAWSPRGEQIALAFWDGRLGIFDIKAENLEYVFKSSEKISYAKSDSPPRIFSVSWDPEGRKVAFASESGKVQVLNIENGHISALSKHSSAATVVSWSPDGKYLATGFYDGLVVVYALVNKKEIKKFESKGDVKIFTDYDEVSKTLAFAISGDYYGGLQFWDVSEAISEKMLSRYTFGKGFDYISFSLGGEYFAAVHRDDTVRLWKISDYELESLNEFKFYDISSKVAWRRDGKYVAVGTRYGSIVLFNVETGHLRWWYVSNEPIEEVTWSPDGKLIAALDLMGFLIVTKPYSEKWLINQPYANEGEFRDLKWDSSKYITLINTGWDELLYIDLNGNVIKRISLRCKFDGMPRFCKGLSYDFSPSGRYAVVSLEDKKIKVIDTVNFDVLKEWAYPHYVHYLKWIDEKRVLACDSHRDWFILVV